MITECSWLPQYPVREGGGEREREQPPPLMATVTVKEKDGALSETQSAGLGDNDLQRLNASLEEFSQQKEKAAGRRKRPIFMLVAVLVMFLVSGGGVALAVLHFVNPIEAEGIRLACDLVLVASGMSLLYTAIHVRGAFSNYVNDAPHIPPHFRGEYVHASALIVARLGIPVWIAAAVATALLISKSEHPLGIFGNQIPYPLIDLIICVVALISFIALAATINKNPTPFALAGISSSSLLTHQDNVFVADDDDEAFLSISRRASMQRAAGEKVAEKRTTPPLAPSPPLARPKSTSKSSSRRTTLTEEALTKVADHGRRVARPNDLDTELMANSPVRPNYYTTMPPVQRSSVPPVPPLPPKLLQAKAKSQSQQRHTLAPPSRGGAGGGWRDDWNDLANQAGITRPRTRSNSSSAEPEAGHELQPLQHSQPVAVRTRAAVPNNKGQRCALATPHAARQQLPAKPGPAEEGAPALAFLVAGFQRQQHQQPVFVVGVGRQHDAAHPAADRGAEEGWRPAAAFTHARARARAGAGKRAALAVGAEAEAAEEAVQLLAADHAFGWSE
ncbi:adenosylmethionine decarboxylase [Apiospora phragmitis]|uniref:Adenosylmethionine decarboxylase n=1 Tax=Apiospora phragmitis TaxID=2905665 RepID=A0ABR1W7V9_9PEZI